MTLKQKQALLAYLGYYDGPLDGLWGEKSQNATEAFQCDFGGISVDGICGEKTEKALRHSVAYGMPEKKSGSTDYTADHTNVQNNNTGNSTDINTGTVWDEIKYFKKQEFACKCGKYCNGYPVDIDMNMVKIADEIRSRIGKPIRINSGIRCKIHNANVGGVSNSQHLFGNAADLGCPIGCTPTQMASIAEEIMGNTGGIGTYSWGIHIDTRSAKSRWNG